MRENADQSNSEYGHFSRSVTNILYQELVKKKAIVFQLNNIVYNEEKYRYIWHRNIMLSINIIILLLLASNRRLILLR